MFTYKLLEGIFEALHSFLEKYFYSHLCRITSLLGLKGCSEQWRSQDIIVARAQHGHTYTFVRTSVRSAEAYRGVWGHPPLPRKFMNFTASQFSSEAVYRSKV